MKRYIFRTAAAALAVAAACPSAAGAGVGPDYVSSDNIELITRIRNTGDGVGARVVGDKLYVTSTVGLTIFDIGETPESPKQLGSMTLDVEWENEEVPTNGKILGISASAGCAEVTKLLPATNCLNLYDVSDASAPSLITSVPGSGDHTSTCILDCTYFYGSEGSITDARDPKNAKRVGDWEDAFPEDFFNAGCHHVREITPGVILGSCQPILLMSVRPQDGGSPEKPVLLASGTNEDGRFIHSGRWPNQGTDRFMLIGGEANAQPVCNDTVSAFQVWNASAVTTGVEGAYNHATEFKPLDEVRPVNGTYVDGRSPYNALGCSVHWFDAHPTFRDGGLVALAEYENGTRLLQVTPEGKINEVGFFLPLGGSTSAPHWHPNGKVIYAIDYTRGVDVLRYTGPTYKPEGKLPPLPACEYDSGFDRVNITARGKGLRLDATLAKAKRYDVTITQRSRGSRVVNKVVARFRGKRAGFAWNGRGARQDGLYTVSFSAVGDNKAKDVRTFNVERKRGRFKAAPASGVGTHCGLLREHALAGPVFGAKGTTLSLQPQRGAEKLIIKVMVGDKVVRTSEINKPQAGKLLRVPIPASLVPRGKTAKVVTTVVTTAPLDSNPVYAKRL